MEALLIGIATAFNVLIIKWKVEHGRYEDAALDTLVLLVFASIFAGTMGGLIIATISSFIVSIYLLFSPPTFLKNVDRGNLLEEWKKRLPR